MDMMMSMGFGGSNGLLITMGFACSHVDDDNHKDDGDDDGDDDDL